MNPHDPADLNLFDIIATVEMADKTLVFLCQDPNYNEEHTLVFYKKDGADSAQMGGFIQQALVGLSAAGDGKTAIIITPMYAFQFDLNKKGTEEEPLIEPIGFSNRTEGSILRNVHAIAGDTYCVDNIGGIHKHNTETNEWENIFSHDDEQPMFNALTGFASDELYAVAFDGQIWHYNGSEWSLKETPTDYILTNACVCGEYVYVCGIAGTLLRGRGDGWEQVQGKLKDPESDKEFDMPFGGLFGIASINDIVLVTNEGAGVFRVKGTDVTAFDDFVPAMMLSSGPSGVLGTIDTSVRLFDGTDIKEIHTHEAKNED